MPEVGSDQQRGGWYDVVERVPQPGQEVHRFTWHDRKAWWQQEQAILAYQILAGSTGDEEHSGWPRGSVVLQRVVLRLRGRVGLLQRPGQRHPVPARHRAAEGQPLDGRLPLVRAGYLAAVYTNLLITKEPMDLYFSPLPGALQGQHPAGRAGPPAAGQHPDRRGRGGRSPYARLRRRGAHRPGPGRQEARQDQGPHPAEPVTRSRFGRRTKTKKLT